MLEDKKTIWATYLDTTCAFLGGLLLLGLVMGNTAFELILALVSLIWLVRSTLVKNNPVPKLLKHPLFVPWIAWLTAAYISLLWNGAGSKGWGHDIALIRYFLYLAAIIDVSGRKAIQKYFLMGMAAAIIWGLINTLLAYAIGYDVFGRALSRYSHKIKDAGRIASVAAYVGPYFVAWGLFDRKLRSAKRVLIILVGIIAMCQVFFIHVRTVEVAAVAGIFTCFVYFAHKRAGAFYSIMLCGGLALILWLFLRYGPKIDLSSIYDRIGYWKVIWAMWQENPVFGVSVSAWQDTYKEFAASDLIPPFVSPDGRSWKALETTHAHNLFLHIISSTGILGIASFGWLFVNCLRMVFKKLAYRGHSLLTWPVVFCVIGLTGWNIYGSQYQTIFTFFMALTCVDGYDRDKY